MKTILNILLLVSIWASGSFAVELSTPDFKVKRLDLTLYDELSIYKDPSLFLGRFSELYLHERPSWDLLMEESPLLTSVTGKVCLMQLGPATEFKNFGKVSLLYEMAEPRLRRVRRDEQQKERPKNPLIIPVKLCGDTAYNDTLGFVLESDLKQAQKGRFGLGTMPPSTLANEIPPLVSQQ